jgi:hypothetical protein
MNVGFALNRQNTVSIHYDKIKLSHGVRFPIIELMLSARQLHRKIIFRDSPFASPPKLMSERIVSTGIIAFAAKSPASQRLYHPFVHSIIYFFTFFLLIM